MDILLRAVADGTLVVILLISIPILITWLLKGTWGKLPIVIMAGLTSLFIAKILSLLYQPAFSRPFLELGVNPGAAYIDNPGFPSDHALLATVVVIAVYAATRSRRLLIILSLLILCMGAGRILALVHTPLDIVVGVVTALAGSLWYRKLTN